MIFHSFFLSETLPHVAQDRNILLLDGVAIDEARQRVRNICGEDYPLVDLFLLVLSGRIKSSAADFMKSLGDPLFPTGDIAFRGVLNDLLTATEHTELTGSNPFLGESQPRDVPVMLLAGEGRVHPAHVYLLRQFLPEGHRSVCDLPDWRKD